MRTWDIKQASLLLESIKYASQIDTLKLYFNWDLCSVVCVLAYIFNGRNAIVMEYT